MRNSVKMYAASLVVAGALALPAAGYADGSGRDGNRRISDIQTRRVTNESRAAARRSAQYIEAEREERSNTKTALMIGGAAATGAGIGGVLKGAKGALIGAALGGGAASIYEATQRR